MKKKQTGGQRMRYFIMIMLAFNITFLVSDAYGQGKAFTAVIGKEGVQRVEVSGGDYYFMPDHNIGKENVPVELKIKKQRALSLIIS
jgi:hypothetical protein